MSSKPTFNEMLDSLTGYEEIAIRSAFDGEINGLLSERPTFAGRALVFTDFTRQGQTPGDAKKAALSLTLAEVNDYFADDEDEAFPEEPVTEQGKDGAPAS